MCYGHGMEWSAVDEILFNILPNLIDVSSEFFKPANLFEIIT
jgi:hypothetical protein